MEIDPDDVHAVNVWTFGVRVDADPLFVRFVGDAVIGGNIIRPPLWLVIHCVAVVLPCGRTATATTSAGTPGFGSLGVPMLMLWVPSLL